MDCKNSRRKYKHFYVHHDRQISREHASTFRPRKPRSMACYPIRLEDFFKDAVPFSFDSDSALRHRLYLSPHQPPAPPRRRVIPVFR